jgi:methylmalonyl-CoA/ethylmalonyl-CoA epimerase
MPDQTLTFDHIGLVVASIEAEAPSLAHLLHLTRWTDRFDDLVLGVSVCFATDPAGLVVELIAPLGPDSPVARAARQQRDCLNQVAYRTDDMAGTRARFEAAGALVLSEPKPAMAFAGALVQFLRLPQGFIVELIGAPEFVHQFVRDSPPT